MSQSAGNSSSSTTLRNGVPPDTVSGSTNEQTSGSSLSSQPSPWANSTAQSMRQLNQNQNQNQNPSSQSDSDEARADRLLRLVLAILRGGSDDSASRLVEAIRQNAREGTDEVDLRRIAERAIRICRDDPGVQGELEVVEALLREFHQDTIYARFPM